MKGKIANGLLLGLNLIILAFNLYFALELDWFSGIADFFTEDEKETEE